MLRVWGKLWKRDRIDRSCTVQDEQTADPLQVRVRRCLNEIVRQFDLPVPLWLPTNETDLTRFGQTKFTADSFIEAFPWQSLEIEIVERDDNEEN